MIQFGIDQLLLQSPSWKSSRIGLITNHAATTNTLIPSRQALLAAGFNIVTLFSPEHGLDVLGADGVKMNDGIDSLTQLPIISLYGNKLLPTESDLSNIDILVFDIPDIGCRFYTYLWTLTYALEAAAQYGKRLIVLDRPNPLSGNLRLAEGPLLDEANCASFIGRWKMPIRHSCTLGELAIYFNEVKKLNAPLEIIRMNDWNREQFQPDWGIDFVPTSPAIRCFEAALCYPGLGLLEATNISEGRGTSSSFTIAGAPWMEGKGVASIFNQMGLDDINVKPTEFMPSHSKYTHRNCSGIEFKLLHVSSFTSVYTGLLFIKLIKNIYPNNFEWKPYPTHVNPTGLNHLDKLLGIVDSEKIFDLPLDQFLRTIQQLTTVKSWIKEIAPFLLYK